MKKLTAMYLALFALISFAFSPVAFADTASYTTLTTAQQDQLNEIGAPTSILASRGVQLGTLMTQLIDPSYTLSPSADSATTNKEMVLALTSPADTTGTNSHYTLDITMTVGNATGGTNAVRGINIANVTGDAQVDVRAIKIGTGTTLGTSYAAEIGSGWDYGVYSASPAYTTFSPGADGGVTDIANTVALTTPADTTGTNTHYGLSILPTIGNASGGTNVIAALQLGNVTGDAQSLEYGVQMGTGYDAQVRYSTTKTGDLALVQGTAGVSSKLWFANDTIVSGQVAKTVTVTGVTTSSKCVAQANEIPSNACYIKSAAPGTDQVVVTVNTDPGASNLDLSVVCME